MKGLKKKGYVVGIDEVGRGALAGPLVAAAVLLPSRSRFKDLKDSKKLSPKKREKWFKYAKDNNGIFWSLARVSPGVIDRINVSQAANLAANRAFGRLIADFQPGNYKVLLDGSLYLNGDEPARTVIKGDEKYNCIKLASIVAKVTRDRYMKKLHRRYPQYGFGKHKGYGTREHIKALRKHGHSQVHRLTFIRKYHKIKHR